MNGNRERMALAIRQLREVEARWLPQFRLEYAVRSGLRYGTAREYELELHIQGTGEMQLFRRRSPGDTASQPPGLFRGLVDRDSLMRMLDALEKAPLDAVPTQVPSPQDPIFTLSCTVLGRYFSFAWSPPSPPVPESLAGLFRLLNDWIGKQCSEPVWSLALKAISTRMDGGWLEATLRLENQGRSPISVVHPASPAPPELMGLGLFHGIKPPREPGVTPPPMEGEETLLEVVPLKDMEILSLEPGRPVEFVAKTTIAAEGSGSRIGVFAYTCYLFPDGALGQPVFTGGVFSEEVPL